MIKLFASDMDGTLLTNHVEVHKNNIQAIRKVQKQGKHFIVCTGRDYLQANFALEQAELHLPVIAMNGAQIFDKNSLYLTGLLRLNQLRLAARDF